MPFRVLLSHCPTGDTGTLGRGGTVEFLVYAADSGLAEAQFGGCFTDAFSNGLHFCYLLFTLFFIFGTESPQMITLTGIANQGESKEAIGLDDFIEEDIISAVLDLTGPGLELFDIPEPVVPA
jgi:hypothetical protein